MLFTKKGAAKSWIQYQEALPLYNKSFTEPTKNLRCNSALHPWENLGFIVLWNVRKNIPLDDEGDGGEISISIDSPLQSDRLELGGVNDVSWHWDTCPISVDTWRWGRRGVWIPSMAGIDTGPYEYDLTIDDLALGAGWTLHELPLLSVTRQT